MPNVSIPKRGACLQLSYIIIIFLINLFDTILFIQKSIYYVNSFQVKFGCKIYLRSRNRDANKKMYEWTNEFKYYLAGKWNESWNERFFFV